MRRPRPTTLPLGRKLLREAVDAHRIRSRLPADAQRTATRYFDEAKLIKASSRTTVHRAIAKLVALELGLSEGTEPATQLLVDAIEDLVGWWDTAATAVNALPGGAGPRRLALLPGIRLLILDLSLRLGGLLRLLDVHDDLLDVGEPAGRGRLFWHVLETERKARELPVKALRPPLGPTRNGLKAWSNGTLPRARNLVDLARLFVPNNRRAAARRRLLSRFRLAIAMDSLHAWLSRTVDKDFAAGALRSGVEMCRVALCQPRPVEDEQHWREWLWELVRFGGRAEGAHFPLQVLAQLAGPPAGMDAVGLQRGPAALLSWWAVVLSDSGATRSGMDRARPGARRQARRDTFEQLALRMLRLYPLGYRGPPAQPPATGAGRTDLWARYWALEVLGAHVSQLEVARIHEVARPGPMASLLTARALRLSGDSPAAERRCWSLHEAHPTWSAPLVELGECALARADYAKATRLLEGALARAPNDDQISFLLAMAGLGVGDVSGAGVRLSGILRRNPSNGQAAAALAACYAKMPGQARKAHGMAKLAARLGRPEGLEALSRKPSVPAKLPQATEVPGSHSPELRGAFLFTLTPIDDAVARRWRPVW